jgi:tetratricopeptide (TPR) repeat protein
MRTVVAALTILALATNCLGSDPRQSSQDAKSLRAQGLELGYNLDHDQALAAFQAAIAADPTDPTAYRLAAATAWIQLLFNQGSITVDDYLGQARANIPKPRANPALAANFHDALEQAIAISETRLRNRPSDADAHFQVGSAFGFLASYTATVEGRLIGSFSPARRAYREHERTLELDPKRYDAGLIVGLYRYAVSNLRAPLRLVAHLAGFGGDRDRAIRLIEDAARVPSDVQANALFTLILIYNRESRYDAALHVIADLKERFPRNRLLWLEEANTALRAGRPRDARAAIEAGLTRFHDDPARWRLAHGSALVALRDPAAGAELHTAIELATSDWVRGRAHKELGRLAGQRGDHTTALTEYRTAEPLCRNDRDDDCVDDIHALLRVKGR